MNDFQYICNYLNLPWEIKDRTSFIPDYYEISFPDTLFQFDMLSGWLIQNTDIKTLLNNIHMLVTKLRNNE